jgi:hypothetical protein
MTVDQLREALASMPGHLPVHIEVPASTPESPDTEFHFTLDCTVQAFPTYGRMAVIRLNPEPR